MSTNPLADEVSERDAAIIDAHAAVARAHSERLDALEKLELIQEQLDRHRVAIGMVATTAANSGLATRH